MSLLTKKLLLLCALTLLSTHNVHVVAHKHVNVANSLEDNLDMYLHCRSGDDDLGEHTLHHGESFGWKFDHNFFGGTKFWCIFNWNGNQEERKFDVFVQSRDVEKGDTLNYYIVKAGPCLTQPDHPLCYNWNGDIRDM